MVGSFGLIKNIQYLCNMSKMKNKHFDEISTGFEKVRLINYLKRYPISQDFSPVLLVKEVYGQFNLTKEEIVDVIRKYYNF